MPDVIATVIGHPHPATPLSTEGHSLASASAVDSPTGPPLPPEPPYVVNLAPEPGSDPEARVAYFAASLNGWEVHRAAVEILGRLGQVGYFRLDDSGFVTSFIPPHTGRASRLVNVNDQFAEFLLDTTPSAFRVLRESVPFQVVTGAIAEDVDVTVICQGRTRQVVHATVTRNRNMGAPIEPPAISEEELIETLPAADDIVLNTHVADWTQGSCERPECTTVCYPFRYVSDYCTAKAALVSKTLAPKGIVTRKVWIYPTAGKTLEAHTVNTLSCSTFWDYHVAVLVRSKKNGLQVIDPSLFPGVLVSLDRWKTAMANHGKTVVTESRVYNRNRSGRLLGEGPGECENDLAFARSDLQSLMDISDGPPFAFCIKP